MKTIYGVYGHNVRDDYENHIATLIRLYEDEKDAEDYKAKLDADRERQIANADGIEPDYYLDIYITTEKVY